jgi:hypothetical protein
MSEWRGREGKGKRQAEAVGICEITEKYETHSLCQPSYWLRRTSETFLITPFLSLNFSFGCDLRLICMDR